MRNPSNSPIYLDTLYISPEDFPPMNKHTKTIITSFRLLYNKLFSSRGIQAMKIGEFVEIVKGDGVKERFGNVTTSLIIDEFGKTRIQKELNEIIEKEWENARTLS